ncbi:MAG: ACT domain-containing protein [Tepidisphaeraceae bacterium]|jgi:hypothetical protein
MLIKTQKVEVWAGAIKDTPGGLAQVLDALAASGADLDCVIARRSPEKPGEGVLFVTPLGGKKAQAAAHTAGLVPASDIATLRVRGENKAGACAKVTRAIADANINLRGVSAAVRGAKFVMYLGFDSPDDADQAAKALKKLK